MTAEVQTKKKQVRDWQKPRAGASGFTLFRLF